MACPRLSDAVRIGQAAQPVSAGDGIEKPFRDESEAAAGYGDAAVPFPELPGCPVLPPGEEPAHRAAAVDNLGRGSAGENALSPAGWAAVRIAQAHAAHGGGADGAGEKFFKFFWKEAAPGFPCKGGERQAAAGAVQGHEALADESRADALPEEGFPGIGNAG